MSIYPSFRLSRILSIVAFLLVSSHVAFAQAPSPAPPAVTPRTPDGHPDLSGNWNFDFLKIIAKADISADGKQRAVLFAAKDGDPKNIGSGTPADRRATVKNKPPYKPELVKKVEDLDDNSNKTDPTTFSCLPPGVPRIGAPTQILQTPGWVTLFYYGGQAPNRFRLIPTDGRAHLDADASFMGDSVGHWEGDTLVVDVTHLSDDTWFGPGYFHSDAIHVVERFTRVGNDLKYEVTVEDPNVLTKPWEMTPKTLHLHGPVEQIESDVPCVDRDRDHLVTNQVN